MPTNEATAPERLSELLGYVEQIVKLDERPAFKLADLRLPSGQTYQFHQHEFHASPGVKHDQTDDDGPIWLTVERLKRRSPPNPPDALVPWLETSGDPERPPRLREFVLQTVSEPEKNELLAQKKLRLEDCHPALADDEKNKFDVRFRIEDQPQVNADATLYIGGSWLTWANEERPRRRSIGLYQKLFEIAQQVELGGPEQAIELVWGIGLSRWSKGASLIDLPLIERLVEIEIDEKAGGLLRIRPRQADAVVNLRPFEELSLAGVQLAQNTARRALSLAAEEDGVSPFARETFEPILRGCQSLLDVEGRYLPDGDTLAADAEVPPPNSQLTVSDRWVIFARRRNENFLLKDIENLRKSVEENRENLPGPANTLVMGPEKLAAQPWQPLSDTMGVSSLGDRESVEPSSPLGDLFFPKPFNEEQVEIIRRLEKEDGVVVQGPPGTGKTHTISNIICHYLATGRRVLVVSHGEAALSVVRDKLPEEVRDLAISITTSEREGLKQLEGAIRILQSIVQTLQPSQQKRLIRDLEVSIIRMRERVANIDSIVAEAAKAQLAEVRGRGIAPSELARFVVEARGACEWFNDFPELFVAETNVTSEDINVLRRQRSLLGKRLEYLGGVYPSVADLPDVQVMVRLHEDIIRAQEYAQRASAVTAFTPRLTSLESIATAESAAKYLDSLISVARHFEHYPWLVPLAKVGSSDAPPTALPALILFSESASLLLEEYRSYLQDPVDLPEEIFANPEIDAVLRKLAEGQSVFGLFAFTEKKLRPIVDEIRYVGRKPQSATEWAHVRAFFQWRKRYSELHARWHAIANQTGLSPDYSANLSVLANVTTALKETLTYAPQVRQYLADCLPRILTLAPGDLWPNVSQLSSLRDCLRDAAAATRLSASRAEVIRITNLFSEHALKIGPIVKSFLDQAAGNPSVPSEKIRSVWNAVLGSIDDIAQNRLAFTTIEDVTRKIRSAGAPNWAERLCQIPAHEGIDGQCPNNWRDAWDWAASMSFLRNIDRRETMRELAAERANLEITLSKSFEKLVRERTFYALAQSMTGPVRAALMMFATSLRRIGAGTGVGASRHRRAAREAMSACYAGVPCWIMPSWRVAEQLPGDVGSFDLVIMDEASQSDVKEVTTLLRGKKILVVGDDKQVSPTAAFIANAKIDRLAHTYLAKQPFKTLLLPGSSLYDLAKVMFPNKFVMLREHFRCVEPIIQFSTQFYSEPLIPLRVPTPHERLDPPLVDIFVPDGVRTGDKINHREAEVIIDEIAKIVETPALATKSAPNVWRSIGVISLIGSKQAALINRMALERFGEEIVMRHKLACGDSATFQGNERDIIFLSMVADTAKKTAQTAAHFEQRFNVAMSRARDRLYLVRSVREEHLNPKDLKANVIRHMREPIKGRAVPTENLEALCDSDFEREVLRRLIERGYRVTPQVGAMGYSIDLVVEGDGNARLAVECDGDKYHGPERWADDIMRQRVLERVGWKFWRCWSSSFTIDPDGCMTDLFSTLDRLGIHPGDQKRAATIYTEHREARRGVSGLVRSRASASQGIQVGDRIVIKNLDQNKNMSVELTLERDDVVNGFVSVASPLGKQLLGANEEDEIEYNSGGKVMRVLIMRVEHDKAEAA